MTFDTGLSAVVANMTNTGPGMGSVGSTANYGHLSQFAKVVLMICQLLGRLELMSFLVLFLPDFWTGVKRGPGPRR